MSEQIVHPRISARYLDSFVGRHVMLVGKVLQVQGKQATVDSDGTVTVLLDQLSEVVGGSCVQVLGKVNSDLTIKSYQAQDLGPDVDLAVYAAVVEATHKHKELFVSES
ncbi:unnamed protein product [Clonostachys rosea f. rosea IK726]|uniref:Replication factor A protein 3 n=2 Tax=Bionectria ochroleuca TaxID=29856 RepID=A0A0B7K2T4_BIOOC|nr:unnamed protein product [Clonostachys rosea f. rosea IK726]